jgi:hypothetical protein
MVLLRHVAGCRLRRPGIRPEPWPTVVAAVRPAAARPPERQPDWLIRRQEPVRPQPTQRFGGRRVPEGHIKISSRREWRCDEDFLCAARRE